MPIPFEELEDSPRIRVHAAGAMAIRRFLIDWADASDFALELVGGYRIIGTLFTFTPPAHIPGIPQCICVDVDINPWPGNQPGGPLMALSDATSQHARALVIATYRTILDDPRRPKPHKDAPTVPEGTHLEWRSRSAEESLPIPGRSWKWATDGSRAPDDLHVGLVVPCTDHRLVWSKVPAPPWSAIRKLRGRVNGDLFLGAGAETVLFAGYECEVVYQVNGERIHTLTYHFLERSVPGTANPDNTYGWNHAYRKDADGSGEHWLKVVSNDAGADPPYALGDFAGLFQFE